MELQIEEIGDGQIPSLDVSPEDQPATRVLTRPHVAVSIGRSRVVEVGGIWEPPVFRDDSCIIQLVELDSDSLQFILLLLAPRNRDKIKQCTVFKKKAATFGVFPGAKDPCQVGIAVVYDFSDPDTKKRVERFTEVMEGWKNRKRGCSSIG